MAAPIAPHVQPDRPRLLLTGFGPFGGGRRNPSEQILPAVAASLADDAEVVTAVLPVEYAAGTAEIRRLIAAHSPDLVVSLGLASGRSAIGVERVAINLAEARIPDESGAQPIDEPLVPGAGPAHFSTLPVLAMAEAITAAGLPGEVSYSAGTYVCNAVMFAALDALASADAQASADALASAGSTPSGPAPAGSADAAGHAPRAGFIHVPDSLEAAADDAEAGSGEATAAPERASAADPAAAPRASAPGQRSGESARTSAASAPAQAGASAVSPQTRRLPEAEIARGVVAAVRAALSGGPETASTSVVGSLD